MLFSGDLDGHARPAPHEFEILSLLHVIKLIKDFPEPLLHLVELSAVIAFHIHFVDFLALFIVDVIQSDLFQVSRAESFSASDTQNEFIERQVSKRLESAVQHAIHAFLNGLNLLRELRKVALNSLLDFRA